MARIILIGIDGFDPVLAQALMGRGLLPAFARLAQKGCFKPLVTSNPAQSPVAWSSIATGSNPGRHGLFDFIRRDPANYLPQLAIKKMTTESVWGKKSVRFEPVLKGTPFWDFTSHAGFPAVVMKWPVSFPPSPMSGKMLAGLGVPDIKNTLGRYTLFTTGKPRIVENGKGDVVEISGSGSTLKAFLMGPNRSTLALSFEVDTSRRLVEVIVGAEKVVVKEGEWSDWVPMRFDMPQKKFIRGMGKFYLESVQPQCDLYLSAMHIDPRDPLHPISSPPSYAAELAREIGPYHTLGLPEETNGLVDGCFSREAFLQFVNALQQERERMFWHELNRFKEGVFAFVFDQIDRVQHVFWSDRDPGHPLHKARKKLQHLEVIEDFYRRMDGVLNTVVQNVNEDDLLIVVSDHGFNSFRRAVHVNTWLVQQGWMVLKKSSVGKPLFEDVDWKRTAAYALGFSSIFLNLGGREKSGMVPPGQQADNLKREIAKRLLAWEDPQTRGGIVAKSYLGQEIYRGPFMQDAPDIVVGVRPGYRFSWETAVGAAPQEAVTDNLQGWSGDHIMDPSYVPGVLFMNKKTSKARPCLTDIAPTILQYCRIPKPECMEGEKLF